MKKLTKPTSKKTNNADLPSKLAIREWLIGQMQIEDAWVLDACAGRGVVWDAMESRVRIRQLVRCDLKPQLDGTLAISATKAMTTLPLHTFNVIDIDPYGEPWEPYLELLARLERPTAVFLTHGCVNRTGGISHAVRDVMGIPRDWALPSHKVVPLLGGRMVLEHTWTQARILYAARIVPTINVTYYALGIEPLKRQTKRDTLTHRAAPRASKGKRNG